MGEHVNTTGPANAGTSRTVPGSGQILDHRRYEAEELADRVRRAGTPVSVVIPARDEDATVADVVSIVRSALVDRVGLVEEILVVDADSTDATGAVARRAGARVVRQSEVLAHLGTSPGKGEAMWKGVAAARGELVVFLDADIVDLEAHFVVGLLGPLLHEPRVQLSKAVYDRPLVDGTRSRPGGGGRVTELLARPALSVYAPELNGLVQPLAGEVGARRRLLRSLPFVRGYGVEVAMLLDVADRFGVDAIAQVDVGTRTHRHQELPALGRMATELLQVIRARRGDAGDIPRMTLWQPERGDDGRPRLQAHDIEVSERPPLDTLGPVPAEPGGDPRRGPVTTR